MKSQLLAILAIIALLCGTISLSSKQPTNRYNAIFNFGDSISDTGNSLLAGDSPEFSPIGNLPYGESFPGGPTGRCSDGRLIIDFLAEALGLPYLPPYLAHSDNLAGGVNFAVAGATALEPELLIRRRISPAVWTNDSLTVQLGWFNKLKPSLCATQQDCDRYLKKSIFLVGEIGGNDYNLGFFTGKTIEELEPLVPLVVDVIINATIWLIEEGAAVLVVPGNFPLGCSASYLTPFRSQNESHYDSLGCLKAFNAFSELHNSQLKASLETLRTKYTHAKIVYADYYGATMRFVREPERYGLNKETLFMVCCQGICGSEGSTSCEDPSSYANWDGIHLTEAAYRIIADGLLNGPFTVPPLFDHPSPLRDFV